MPGSTPEYFGHGCVGGWLIAQCSCNGFNKGMNPKCKKDCEKCNNTSLVKAECELCKAEREQYYRELRRQYDDDDARSDRTVTG